MWTLRLWYVFNILWTQKKQKYAKRINSMDDYYMLYDISNKHVVRICISQWTNQCRLLYIN